MLISRKIVKTVAVAGILCGIAAIAIHSHKHAIQEERKLEAQTFYATSILEPLQRLRKTYPQKEIRALLDGFLRLGDEGRMAFLAASRPKNPRHEYGWVLDGRDPGTYFIAFSIDNLKVKREALNPEAYEDFLVLIFIHESLHIVNAGGRRIKELPETMEAIHAEESRVWWDVIEQGLVPMRESGRASGTLDQNLELALQTLTACPKGTRECPSWGLFISRMHPRK